jgi:adenosylmethionine-8-amino-7-oxononanoate aminotransferase
MNTLGGPAPAWQQSAHRHVWQPYTQMQTAPWPAPVVATEGVRIQLADGRWLVDSLGSWWTAVHGYNHPHIREAVSAQLATMPHVMFGGITHEPAARLATRLAALLPGDLDHVFLAESGSVSVEIALKMAVQFHLNHGRRRTRFLSFERGYHGDTLATMSVCDPVNSMHAHFRGWLPEQLVVPLPTTPEARTHLEDTMARHADELAAVVVEPLVQGAGGFRFHDADTLRHLRSACDAHGVLLIFDEIATGFGRTGAMFACEQAGVLPDVITLSKALTGGTLPLSAAVARTTVWQAFQSDDPMHALMHGPTYMANPLGCAAANASLDLFEQEPRLEGARRIARVLAERLAPAKDLPHVADVRTKGAVGVIQVDRLRRVPAMQRQAIDAHGVWLRPFGDCIYTTPPLVTEDADLGAIAAAMVDAAALLGAA